MASTSAIAQDITYTDQSNLSPITTGGENDTVVMDNSYMSDDHTSAPRTYIDTGDGNDELIFKNTIDGIGPDNPEYHTGNGDDTIIVNTISSDDDTNVSSLGGAKYYGDDGNDQITIRNTTNTLYNFTMNGGTGNDDLTLDHMNDTRLAQLIGGAGDDNILISNSTCTTGCYIDGDDATQNISGENNTLTINNSTVVVGEEYKLYDDDNNQVGVVSGGINNFSEVNVTNHSALTIGGDTENSYVDNSDTTQDITFPGGISNIGEINVTDYSSLTIDGTAADSLADTDINISSNSTFIVDGQTDASLNMNIASLSTESNTGGITYSAADKDTINVSFKNGQQSVTARAGAYNYDATIIETENTASPSSQLQASSTDTITASVNQKQSGLANDVQGVIAGLDAAKQASNVIADDISAHLDTMNNINLLHGVQEGVGIWGDFLYQNGNYQDEVNYKSVLQGTQAGMDWTKKLDNNDSLTGGIALGYVRNKTSHNDSAGHFDNDAYGNYYSLYGSWQQHLQDTGWGLFADGSFSYGDMRYSMSGSNVSSLTDGSQQSYSSSYDGNAYNVSSRVGVNIRLPAQALLQTYALAGWDKVTSDSFSESGIDYADNNLSVWHAGAGMRVTADMTVANIHVMPWADAHYQAEFADNSDFTAADYHMDEGNNQQLGVFSLGVSAGMSKDLTFNVGTYYGTGDVDSDLSVQAGLNYHF